MNKIRNFFKKYSGYLVMSLIIIGLIALNILNYNGRLEAEKNYKDSMESYHKLQETSGLQVLQYKHLYEETNKDYWELLSLYKEAITPKLVK